MDEPRYSEAEVEAAVAAVSDPERLQAAQDLVMRAAPQLQRVLEEALRSGGWFGAAHADQVRRAAADPDPQRRSEAVDALVAEEVRLGMLVGVAVGFELARELKAGN